MENANSKSLYSPVPASRIFSYSLSKISKSLLRLFSILMEVLIAWRYRFFLEVNEQLVYLFACKSLHLGCENSVNQCNNIFWIWSVLPWFSCISCKILGPMFLNIAFLIFRNNLTPYLLERWGCNTDKNSLAYSWH